MEWLEARKLSGEYTLDFRQGASASFRRTWLVRTEQGATEYNVLSDAGAPQLGHAHPRCSAAYCTRIEATPVGPYGWIVEAQYQTPTNEQGNQSQQPPLNRAARIRWGCTSVRMPVYYDSSGNPILNTAGDAFDPPLEIDVKLPVVSVSKNLSAVPAWVLSYRNAINSSAWYIDGLIILAKCARIDGLEISEWHYEQGVAYREVSYSAIISPTAYGWQPRLLNCGYNEKKKVGDETKRMPILINGMAPSSPVLLDSQGQAIQNPTSNDAVWLTFNVYPELDFNSLPSV